MVGYVRQKIQGLWPKSPCRITQKLEAGAWIHVEAGFDQPEVAAYAVRAEGQLSPIGIGHLLPSEGDEAMAALFRLTAGGTEDAVP
jgi:hypothetical protein